MAGIGSTVILGLLIAGIRLWSANTPPIRIGVDQAPPFQSIRADGTIQSLSVDVLNEAAKNTGLRIVFVPVFDMSLDMALERRVVDMWPLAKDTTERRARLYVSDPWLDSDYMLLSRAENPVTDAQSARGRVIAYLHTRVVEATVHQFLPDSQYLETPTRLETYQAVCSGKADAAIVESRIIDAILLERPAGCEKTPFFAAVLKGARKPLSLLAVPEKKNEAIILRREVERLTLGGFLSAKIDQWTPVSAEGSRAFWKAKVAEQRMATYRIGLIFAALFTLVLGWLTRRASRLKRTMERAQAGLRESEKRFAAFMENSPVVSFMKDARAAWST